MTVTAALDASLIKCDSCPNTIADDAEGAEFLHGWSQCRESSLWTCACCLVAEHMAHVVERCGDRCKAVRP